MTIHTFSLDTEAAAKGEQLAVILGIDLSNNSLVCQWLQSLGDASNPAATMLAHAWTARNEGFVMSPNGIVVKAQIGESYRTLTAEEIAYQAAQEAAYAENCDC
jgi:hypothetical protein